MKNLLLIIVLCGLQAGCSWVKDRWPWREEQVPVTAPAVEAPPEPESPSSPPLAAAPLPGTQGDTASRPPRSPLAAGDPNAVLATQALGSGAAPVSPPDGSGAGVPTAPVGVPAPAPAPAEPDPNAQIVAAQGLMINDRFVSVEDMVRAVAPLLAAIPADVSEAEFRVRAAEILQQEVQRQVDLGLVLPEAKTHLTDQHIAFIDAQVIERQRMLIAGFDGSRKATEDHYRAQGTTFADVLRQYRDYMTVQIYLRTVFEPAVSVNRRMLWNYYQEHLQDKYSTPRTVQMQIIEAPLSEHLKGSRPTEDQRSEARAKARAKIDEARAALKAGKDFGDVAKQYSAGPFAAEGGLWPALPAGSFREAAVEQAAFALEPGEHSEIIETESGFFLVRAAKVTPGETTRFEDAQADIEKELREQQYRRLRTQFYERLFQRARLQQPRQLVEQGVERAVQKYRGT